MESNFNNRDFEQFVKQNADQYRMFPSEKVWKGINSKLHARRQWYGWGLVLLLLTTGSVTWVMLSPTGKGQSLSKSPFISSVNSSAEEKEPQNLISRTKNNVFTGIDELQKEVFASNNKPSINNISISEEEVPSVIKNRMETNIEPISRQFPVIISSPLPFVKEQPAYYAANNWNFTGIVVDDIPEINISKVQSSINDENKIDRSSFYPLTIESVVNIYDRIGKKLSWQIYFTPTISYRKLAENKAFLSSPQSNNNPYSYAAIYDINSAVTHKPDMGFEMGFSAGYPITRNLKIVGGLQFNVSKYDIKAFTTYPTELATIALNTGTGYRAAVSTPTNYRNFGGGYKQDWLHNFYMSASAPIGAELKIKGNTKTHLGIAGTIQPTYILGDRAYMLSTDYKNYAKVPQLMRHWNLGSSFEIFGAYSTGRISWKIGPQVRYQLLSSFQKKYPVKEHIFDFGLKVGMMLRQ